MYTIRHTKVMGYCRAAQPTLHIYGQAHKGHGLLYSCPAHTPRIRSGTQKTWADIVLFSGPHSVYTVRHAINLGYCRAVKPTLHVYGPDSMTAVRTHYDCIVFKIAYWIPIKLRATAACNSNGQLITQLALGFPNKQLRSLFTLLRPCDQF